MIKSYDIDSLAIEISEFTSTPLPLVFSKPFMGYLKGYLSRWAEKSIVLENDYIDSGFLDDYSKYYAKNFRNYSKKCLRIHFFNIEEKELQNIHHLTLSNHEISEIKEKYIGYAVIRPIPEFFVGKVCLKHWFDDEKHFFLSAHKSVQASLFGIDFAIDTIPFMEQDHVISVCATSALWSFFHASKYIGKESLKSPFSITKDALVNNNCYDDNNLTPGYTVEMICDCIKNNGLIPLHFDVDVENEDVLKEYIHCFLESGYPVILGLDVYRKKITENPYSEKFKKDNKGKDDYEFHGLHAVTVLGDCFVDSDETKIYIHDDMIGPYACLHKSDFCWELDFKETASHSLEPHSPEFYVPTDIIIGIHPKIRLPYKSIRLFCKYLLNDINSICNHGQKDSELIKGFKYKVRVIESNNIKSFLRTNASLYYNAEDLVITPLPRFVWIADFYYGESNVCFSFVFDATEVPQGKSLLYILYADVSFVKILTNLYNFYKSPIINNSNKGNVYEMMDSNVYPFYNYFNDKMNQIEKHDELLTRLFGNAKSPKYIKDEEYVHDEVKGQNAFKFKCFEDVEKNKFSFDKNQEYYLWIIDEEGYLYIGTENKDDPNALNKGHPTIINGRKGRIGGEIHYSRSSGNCLCSCKKWIIDSKSGRYSWSDSNPEKINEYLKNALTERFIPYFKGYTFEIKEL